MKKYFNFKAIIFHFSFFFPIIFFLIFYHYINEDIILYFYVSYRIEFILIDIINKFSSRFFKNFIAIKNFIDLFILVFFIRFCFTTLFYILEIIWNKKYARIIHICFLVLNIFCCIITILYAFSNSV